MNIIMTLRLKDNQKRVYMAPDGFVIPKGTLLEVEYLSGTSLAVAVSDNHEVDGEQEALIRDMLHINPNAELRKVMTILNRTNVPWPVEDADTDDDQDEDDQDEDDTEA